jgi:chromate reductase, NAD(P)H dehydrogenase (quinone)
MKIVLFAGSLRKESINKKLIRVAQKFLLEQKHDVQLIDLKSLNIPVYDGDIEDEGIPEDVKSLAADIEKCNAVIISSPEYNHSIAGSLKNTIDWVSRVKPPPFDKKPVLLMGASPGGFGALRGVEATRTPFESMNAYVHPQMFALQKAGEAFSADGALKDSFTQKRLESLLNEFIQFSHLFL